LAEAVGGSPDVAIWSGPVTSAGRIEMLPFLHEQAVSITAHRFGNPDRGMIGLTL
jgi:RHH-type proline utilization regulon transcriptional repressor/proline dehydrogenase/delta 1-pyrroline-5-carboxylate dehydrogenase